jgi:hypothetical protein
MTRVIYVTHNTLSRLISLIDYVGESTSMIINELNEKNYDANGADQKKNMSEMALSKMNTHTQNVKNELMEIINEQIPFVTERRELLKKIDSSKKNLTEFASDNNNEQKANYWIDANGKLREHSRRNIE